jgi:hypothetical protein
MKILLSILILASAISANAQLFCSRDVLKYPLKTINVYCQMDTSRSIAKKELFYDQNHRLIKECVTTANDQNYITYMYNEQGLLTMKESTSVVNKNSSPKKTVFTYNDKNQLITEKEDSSKTISYEYKGEKLYSKLVENKDINISTLGFYTYKYDKQNRLAEIYLNGRSYVSYEYTDTLLRRESYYGRRDDNFATTDYKYEYNNNGLLVKVTKDDKTTEKYIYDNHTQRRRYYTFPDSHYYQCRSNYLDKFEYYSDSIVID